MEKKLTQKELLQNLIKTASNPFTTIEQKRDIQKVLEESSNFKGANHLFLVECYLNSQNPLFVISEAKAIAQTNKALKEHNVIGYYYLYILMRKRNPLRARTSLRMACEFKIARAWYALGKEYLSGDLFDKDRIRAFDAFERSAQLGDARGYVEMLLIAAEDGDYEKQKKILKRAEDKGVLLPGVVR